MKVKIGAIGPSDSLKQIREVAVRDARIELTEFDYVNPEELDGILTENRHSMDQWIFSGQSPYHYCLERGLITSEEAQYAPLHGTALLGACLRVSQDHKRFVGRMSLDSVNPDTVQKVFSEYQLEGILFELFPYEGYKPREELIDFHIDAYENGRTEAALTCVSAVYRELRGKGIPCYRVVPSKQAIQPVLKLLVSRAQNYVFEKLKISVIGVSVLRDSSAAYSFAEQEKELELEQEFLRVTKNLNGSLFKKGKGIFFIYTTQGDYELLDSAKSIVQVIDEIKMRTSRDFHTGIGSGYTVYGAEQNMQTALSKSVESDSGNIIHIDQEQKVSDLAAEYKQSFSEEQLPKYWKEVLQNNKYRTLLPVKIYHYVKLKNLEEFTSDQITQLLKNTDRNTRRILHELEEMKLIKVSGEENSGKPGRPKKVYQFIERQEESYQ